MKPLCFEVPIRTAPGQNAREHWRARAKRVKTEKARTIAMMRVCALALGDPVRAIGPGPWVVTLTRRAPTRGLDAHDNLRGALKACVDGVADVLGVDDGDISRVRWEYRQERGPWAVVVEVRQMTDEDRAVALVLTVAQRAHERREGRATAAQAVDETCEAPRKESAVTGRRRAPTPNVIRCGRKP